MSFAPEPPPDPIKQGILILVVMVVVYLAVSQLMRWLFI